MATRVELTTRDNRSDILNEIKSSRGHVGPLSDASNKSSDSNISSSLIIEDTAKVPSKPVNMFNSVVRPRLSPKPFFRESPLENRRSVGTISAYPTELSPRSDVPYQASSSISLSSSGKSDEIERVGRRIVTSYQPSAAEDQDKAELVISTTGSKKLTSSSWAPANVSDTKSTSQTDEIKVTSKPPLMSRKPDISQQETIFDIHSRGIFTNPDEQKESSQTKDKNDFPKSERIDSATVRAQLRPKRRPVSMFINDSANDSNADEDQRTWNRRPLSSDLTSLFESKGVVNKKANPSEESKENRPLKKSSPSSSIIEGQSDIGTKEVDFAIRKNIANEIRTGAIVSSSRSKNPTYTEKERTCNRDQELANVAEDEGVNVSNKVSKTVLDSTDGQTNEQKNAVERSIAPGTIQRRISLFLANSTSMDFSDVPTNKEDRNASNTERKTTSYVSDKDTRPGRPQAMSQPMSTEFTKKCSASPSDGQKKPENTSEENSAYVSQDYGLQKDKTYWRASEFSEQKQLKTRRSFRKVDEPLQLEDIVNVSQEKKYSYKYNKYDTKMDLSEKDKDTDKVDKTVKTVTATMFEHNVERHNAAKAYNASDPILNYTPKTDVSFERPVTQHEQSSWSKWLIGDSVHSVPQQPKEPDVSGKITERSFGQSLSSAGDGNVHGDMVQIDDDRRVQPRYEVVQSLGEKVSSESVKMAPEDKAVTLRSQRSFHKKEKEPNKLELEETYWDRPASGLQRSRSAYIKRSTQDSTKESLSRTFFPTDDDITYNRRNVFRKEKMESVKSPTESPYIRDRTYLTSKDKSIEFLKKVGKSQKSDNESNRVSTLDRDGLGHPSFGISTEDSKGTKKYLNEFSRQAYESINEPVERVPEITTKIVNEESPVTVSPALEKTHLYHRCRFPSDNEPGQLTSNVHKSESNDFLNVMLNQDIEKIKRDLSLNKDTIEKDFFPTIKPPNKDSEEELTWIRRKTSFPNNDATNYGAAITSDLLKSENDEGSRQTDWTWKREIKDEVNTTTTIKTPSPVETKASTAKTSSPFESKATYFAVTCIDKKKEKNYNNLENLSSGGSNFILEESSFQRDVKMNTIYPKTHSNYFTEEEKMKDRNLGISSASNEFKTYRNQKVFEHDLVGKLEKTPERQNVVDIDLLLKRHKQKPSLDDKGPFYRDSSAKPQQKTYESEFADKQEQGLKDSPVKMDGTYKSKVVDIDSLMADYNANQLKEKELTLTDDQNVSVGQRSRSFRGSTTKGSSSKWKDPPKTCAATDGYGNDSVASWYASQETPSPKVDLKQDPFKISAAICTKNSLTEGSYDKNTDKGRESVHAHPEKSQNIITIDSLLESSLRSSSNYKSRSEQVFDFATQAANKSTPLTPGKYGLNEMSVDEHDSIFVVKHEQENSIKTDRRSISSDDRRKLSEGRHQRKASDLINLMLESKDKRGDQHHARQIRSLELLQESRTQESRTQRLTNQQDRRQRDSKDYEKEESKRRITSVRELEPTTDHFVTRRLNRQSERSVKTDKDHVKQCFSRSSTSNKDTDSIVQESDRQYGTWSQEKPHTEDSFVCESPSYDNFSSRKQHSHSRLSSLSHTETEHHDSITEAQDGSLDRSSMDLDSTEGTESTPSFTESKADDFSFVDQTSVLDSTALKNRVQLSRKSQRRAPSQLQRKSRLLQSSSQLAVIEDTDSPWMFTDSTEEKPQKKEEIEEQEEKPQRSSVQSQRMPMFPGMDHSTLMAQLRKRQDAECSSEPTVQPSKSPKSPLGVKLLPTSSDLQDRGAGGSPQWLKELKSKKRQSQYENHS